MWSAVDAQLHHAPHPIHHPACRGEQRSFRHIFLLPAAGVEVEAGHPERRHAGPDRLEQCVVPQVVDVGPERSRRLEVDDEDAGLGAGRLPQGQVDLALEDDAIPTEVDPDAGFDGGPPRPPERRKTGHEPLDLRRGLAP